MQRDDKGLGRLGGAKYVFLFFLLRQRGQSNRSQLHDQNHQDERIGLRQELIVANERSKGLIIEQHKAIERQVDSRIA